MKIGYFTNNFPPRIGGVATYSFELPYFMAQNHPEIEVGVFVFGKEEGTETKGNLKITRLKKNSPLSMGKEVAKIIAKNKFDVVHTTTFFPTGFFVALFAKIFRVKSHLTVYGTEVVTNRGRLITKIVQYLTLILVSHIFPFSQSTNNLMFKRHKHLNKKKATVACPGISQLEINKKYSVRDKFNIKGDDFVVLFVGRLVERKGAFDLINAVKKTGDEKVKLILVGGGERKKLEKHVSENNLNNQIYFAGSVPREEILNYYFSADVFSMPSFFDTNLEDIEGLGIVYLEAQINGVPVIGTSSGGIPEAIDDNKSGFVVEPRDVLALSEKINILKNDKKLYERMSQAAKDFVKKEFSWQKNNDKHLEIYKNGSK
jgi:glycosyltransferase involved in cell wall biosynthesis